MNINVSTLIFDNFNNFLKKIFKTFNIKHLCKISYVGFAFSKKYTTKQSFTIDLHVKRNICLKDQLNKFELLPVLNWIGSLTYTIPAAPKVELDKKFNAYYTRCPWIQLGRQPNFREWALDETVQWRQWW